MAIYRGDGGAGDATDDITINQVTTLTQEAADSATAAASSASAASTSASNAAASASAASTSASNAATSATNAASSATAAASSASAASTSATAAASSASAAASSASAASASETAAAASEAAAATSETNAAASEAAAATSETNAASSASSASTSATNAATSETNAAASEAAAATSEANAATSETNAAASASAAATSETNAAASETAAASSASSASTSATSASSSASSASTSASNAATSESNAATSETNAAASEAAAATSETNAAASASAAATSESNASSSATAAASSASSAATSAANAAAVYDQFDDRYLGSKSTAPTLDNDGNALVTGALYYDTTEGAMYVYDGSQWLAASAASQAILTVYNYTATSSQTTFSGVDDNAATLAYVAGSIIVTINGVFLEGGTDYTATNGTSVVLASGAVAGDEVNIYSFNTFDVANVQAIGDDRYVRLSTDQTVAGVKTLSSNPILSAGTANGVAYLNGSKALTTGSALVFDGTNLGIGTSSPATKLDVQGGTNVTGNWNVTAKFQDATSAKGLYLGYNSSTADAIIAAVQAGAGLQFWTYNGGWGSSLNLTASGNLGLGVTPSAWQVASGRKAIEVGSAGNGLYGYSASNFNMSSGAYYDGSWKYAASGTAVSYYNQSAGLHQWYTAPSGTAGNAITFTQAMTLDASGRLGIGVTSPSLPLEILGASTTYGDARYNLGLQDTASATTGVGGGIGLSGYTNGTSGSATFAQIKGIKENSTAGNTAGAFVITTLPNGGAPTERARIDSSGNLLLATTSTIGAGKLSILGAVSGASDCISTKPSTSGTYNPAVFYDNGGTIRGYIQTTTTATTFATSSDYRLKENITPMTGALATVAQLNPVTYNWKADGSAGQGFIAHELQAVVPDCVTGEKDAVDADGNPVYQGIDTSFLVATLTAAIQEQQAIIAALTDRITALENK